MAGALRLKGFSPPRTTLPSSAINERGFWESEPINALNDEFLAELGSTWHGIDTLRLDHVSPAFRKKAAERAERVLIDEFDAGARPLIKDPRLCRLLPLWQPAVMELSSDVIYSIALRSPSAVAESLRRRNDFDPESSFLLWARYYLDAELHTRGSRRTVVAYDELVVDWRTSLRQFAGLGLEATQDSDSQVDEYLSSALRHHRTADEQVFIDLEHLPPVLETYRALLDWATSGEEPDPDVLDELRGQIDYVGGMVSRLVDNARLDRKRLASAKSSQMDAQRRVPADLAQLKASLEKQSKAQSRLEERLECVAESLSEAIRERSSVEQLLIDTRAEADARRAALEHELGASERDREALSAELETVRRDEQAAVAALSAETDELRTELKDVKKKYRSTQHQLSRDRERLKRTDERLAEEQKALKEIRASRLWRMQAGLSAVSQRSMSLLKNPLGLSGRKLRADQARRLRESPLFDGDWYLQRYPDVATAGIDPAIHYLESGWKEGRDPSKSFSTNSYLKSNPDVGRAGLHPLLHFIEFGYAEGRHISDAGTSPPVPIVPTDETFDPAAPCASFDIPEMPPVRWRRTARLEEDAEELLVQGGVPIGFARDASIFEATKKSFDLLAKVSGHGAGSGLTPGCEQSDAAELADAWFIANGRLRTRWRSAQPMVVRAYQHLSEEDGVSMVAEGLARTALDFVDANLKNQYFPLLFVLSDPKGELRGCALLGFPSLCRGGAHYPELLALQDDRNSAQNETIDIIGASGALIDRLIEIVDQRAKPLIGGLRIDLLAADGTEHAFQSEFQEWLSAVLRIGMTPTLAKSEGRRFDYLAGAIAVEGDRDSGGMLRVAANIVPAIGALVMSRAEGAAVEAIELPLLIAGIESTQPATLIRLPAKASSTALNPEYGATWPVLLAADGMAPAGRLRAAGIRHSNRPIPTDAELLVPVSGPDAIAVPFGKDITWLVFPEYWSAETLHYGLQALSEQGASAHLLMVGKVQQSTVDVAREIFNGRVMVATDLTAGLGDICTPLVGYLGPNVILHDHRTSGILGNLVENVGVVTASCVLVSAEKRGKDWHVSVEDSGVWQSSMPQNLRHEISRLLWRTTYPVLRPPTDLWVARSSSVNNWLQRAGPLRPEEGLQLCTSLVSASYAGDRVDAEAPLSPPTADERVAMSAELLFG